MLSAMSVTLTVNGRTHELDVDPETPLLFVLSDDLALRGPKFGCGLGQCGFCLSGVVLTAKAFLDRNPRATDEQVRQALSGVLCRCFANARMLAAVRLYASGRAV
jgi:aerobic-type carbon monoxide dehydrogenase small subunit (CoxS/CutS family)